MNLIIGHLLALRGGYQLVQAIIPAGADKGCKTDGQVTQETFWMDIGNSHDVHKTTLNETVGMHVLN